MTEKEKAIEALKKLPESEVHKVLIFLAGLQAGAAVSEASTEKYDNSASDKK